MRYILMVIFLSLPVTAHADWGVNAEMHPTLAPNFSPNQGPTIRHEEHVNAPAARVEPQHHVASQRPVVPIRPVVVRTAQQIQYKRQEQRVNHSQATDNRGHRDTRPGYFRRDANYYGYVQVLFPDADIDTGFAVPDGFETVILNGETFYYHQGIFYQEVDNQLTVIPAVLGAVVDSIPEDYQIVMADGVHYLVTGGIYYQRVDQGFEVVQPPASDLE